MFEKFLDIFREAKDIAGIATLFLIVGFIVILSGLVELSGTTITTRTTNNYGNVILGASILFAGLILLYINQRKSSQKENPNIIFYAPTIQTNSFFASLLEHILQLVHQKGYSFTIETANYDSDPFDNKDHLNVLNKYRGEKYDRSVMIMVPPNPNAYEEILEQPKDTIRLITLDMEISSELHHKLMSSEYHRYVVHVDNQLGAEQAAEEVWEYCKVRRIQKVNLLICEGKFHQRGHFFKQKLQQFADAEELAINLLGDEELSFTNTTRITRNYVLKILKQKTPELQSAHTFVFCANDNMAIGARLGVSGLGSDTLATAKDIQIICFDASDFIKTHILLNDRYLWRAVDQNYKNIIREALKLAENILEDEEIRGSNRVKLIKPTIFRPDVR